MKDIKINIPKGAEIIIDTLIKNGFKAYLVGGCVRDSLLGRTPKDWDITTDAKPEDVMRIFEPTHKVIPTGLKHGTVTLIGEELCGSDNIPYEVTTFRIDGDYSDNRHPDCVVFTNSLKEDLSRRDTTINAMAYNSKEGLIDYFNGLEDLKKRIIRCVGEPSERLLDDALRMIRCIRISCELGFNIEQSVIDAIVKLNGNIKNISKERIRDELCKILILNNSIDGICHLIQSDLMRSIIPELYDTLKFNQYNIHHDKDVFMHTLSVVENSPSNLKLILSALLHDVAKPKCFSKDENYVGHFYEHAKLSADLSREILTRLKFDNKTIDTVCKLVYNHMTPTDLNNKSIKKLITRVGQENIYDLIELMIADRKGMAPEYRTYDDVLELKSKIDSILNESQPLTVKDLAIDGNYLIKLGFKQGKAIGQMLNILLEAVLENPELNEEVYLLGIISKTISK